ncbi:MAG TPA: precorrin-4 C(11)-methyltransferase [Candidatus Deferrimicrobium sp.]|nr:precorrin-4 C(11)-methyltransferase [Candidatus Deferrimicrobium sp.]
MSQVVFVGAGPGDPELITLKGIKAIEQAQVVIYAGSLVNPEILRYAPQDAEVHNSASMTLEQVIEVMDRSVKVGKRVARVHTGDPSIYGAIQEQIDQLENLGISYTVIPGVSSFLAAAASLRREYTLPGVSQTVILTRIEGRTPVPQKERLGELAKHRATMGIFLSVQDIERVMQELREGYLPETPVAVVYKASWPEEKIIRGTLENIAQKVREQGVSKTALILVGDFLGDEYERSLLYHPGFSHEFREGSQ